MAHHDTSVQSGLGRDWSIADIDERALVCRNTVTSAAAKANRVGQARQNRRCEMRGGSFAP